MQIGDAPQETADPLPLSQKPEPTPLVPTVPDPAPAPPRPQTPADDYFAELAGAQKAALASSMAGAVQDEPTRAASVVKLADQLGVSADVVKGDYDHLKRAVQLKGLDYGRLIARHPDVASWLAVPENAAVAHQDVPVLQQIDHTLKGFSEFRKSDAFGILPPGYQFMQGGQVRGPIVDGQAQVYANLDEVQKSFARRAEAQGIRAGAYDAEHGTGLYGNDYTAALQEDVASTLAALASVGGHSDDRASALYAAQQYLQEASARDPSLGGGALRLLGQLTGDAPLYLAGGEVVTAGRAIAGASDVAQAALRFNEASRWQRIISSSVKGSEDLLSVTARTRLAETLKALDAAKPLPKDPLSLYLVDAFKTAAAYSPIAARTGANDAAEHGTTYGVTSFLINAAGPAAFGSRFGLAKALIPGEETVPLSGGLAGVAGRLLKHTSSQAGVMAFTELGNALHEATAGVDPDALDLGKLLPRLGQAGAMGAVLSGAFHVPGEIGAHVYRQQVAAKAALTGADRNGQLIEMIQVAQVNQLSPERLRDLLNKAIPTEARTWFAQTDDWEGIAKAAKVTPDELATMMHAEGEWQTARDTGKTMEMPRAEILQRLAAIADKQPEVAKAALEHLREHPLGTNVQEALTFYTETPAEVDKQVAAMKAGVEKAAKTIPTSDPIYTDFRAKAIAAGESPEIADQVARLNAALYHTRAALHGPTFDPWAEYQKDQLRIESAKPEGAKVEVIDQMLNRLRSGDVPTEKQIRGESLLEWLRKRGIKDDNGDVASLELDSGRSKKDLKANGPLLRDDGIGLDIAAHRAHEEGFIPDDQVSTLLDALDKEGRGNAVYRAGAGDAQTEAVRDALRELDQHIRSKGLSIKQPNAELKAAIMGEAPPAVAKYEQRLEVPSAHLRHEYLLKQWKKAHGDRSPTPTDKDWQKLVHQADMVDEAQGRRFFQPGDEAMPKGFFEKFADNSPDGRFLIALTRIKDVSTLAHEWGHYTLEKMGEWSERADAPESVKADWAKILDYLGVRDRGEIGTKEHETWARSIEQYLMEGNAPSEELRPVFQRFALWLTHLYSRLKGLVILPKDIKGVIDRMLATEAAIEQVRKELGASTIFPEKPADMPQREWDAYLSAIERDKAAAHANVYRRAIATLKRENSKTWKREHGAATAEAERIVNARPVFRAEDALILGIDRESGDALPEKPKLDRAEILRDYGEDGARQLPRGITSDEKGAWSMDQAATEFGFRSGSDLWEALANLPDRKQVVREMADDIMKSRHPDLSPDVMVEKAMEAVHANSAHGDVLGRESTYLAVKANRRAIPQSQLRDLARERIANTKAQDVKPEVYLRAEKTASKEATDALIGTKEPKWAEALEAKQREEFAHQCYRAAQEAQEVIAKTEKLMTQARKRETRQMLGKAGGQTWIVTTPDGLPVTFVGDESATAADQAASFAKASGGTAAQGEGYLAAMDALRNFWHDDPNATDMTFGAVSDFYDTARSLMHQARREFTILVNGKQERLEEEVAKGARQLHVATPKGPKKVPVSRGPLDRVRASISKFDALMRSMSFVARQFDGEKSGGWFWEHFVRPANAAADNEMERSVANAEVYKRLRSEWGKTGLSGKKLQIPEVGEGLTLESRIAVLLNAGAVKNYRRLRNTFSDEQIQAIINTLDEKDIAFVKGVWAHSASFWPESEATSRRLTGLAPEKKELRLVQTKFGTIDGGYHPIAYDMERMIRAGDIDMIPKKAPLLSGPAHGFLKKVAEDTGYQLRLDLSPIKQHWSSVAHYLSHADTIDTLSKLLRDPHLRATMIDRFGMDSFKVIRDTVNDMAKGMQGPENWLEGKIRFLRQRSGMAVMGYNVMSGASQIFGATQSMERVGVQNYMSAVTDFFGDAGKGESLALWIRNQSSLMAHRGKGLTIEEIEAVENAGPVGSVPAFLRTHAYDLMNKSQALVDYPTWWAEYNNAMRERPEGRPEDHATAVALADQAVLDTQGSGFVKDLAKAQRANEFMKTLMQFGGFFVKSYNLSRARVVGTDIRNPEHLMQAMKSFLLLVSLPTVAMSVFREAVKTSPSNDNSASWWAKKLAKDHVGYLLNMVIGGRELTGALDGYDYQGPAGLRSFSIASKVVKEIANWKASPHAAEHSIMDAAGLIWGLPANQAEKIIDGIIYDSDHGSYDLRRPLFGPPPKR